MRKLYVDDPIAYSPSSSSLSPSEVNGAVNARVAKSEAAEADKVAETSETEHLSSLDETETEDRGKGRDNSASADGGGDIGEKGRSCTYDVCIR